MAPRKKPQQLDLVEHINSSATGMAAPSDGKGDVRSVSGNAGSSPAVAGHNSQVTDNDLIAENHKLEDQLKAGLAKYNEWAKPYKARVDEIENEIQRRLLERGADSTKTEAGTAYLSDLMNTKIESVESLFDFVADNWDDLGGEAKISLPVAAVRQYMDQHEGQPPPGISISYYRRLNIRRS